MISNLFSISLFIAFLSYTALTKRFAESIVRLIIPQTAFFYIEQRIFNTNILLRPYIKRTQA